MSKTKLTKLLDRTPAQKQERKASVRFKTERTRKADTRLFKQEMRFTPWIERTLQND